MNSPGIKPTYERQGQSLKGLYAITDPGRTASNQELYQQVRQAIQGGARWVQYRDKTNDNTQRERRAYQLLALCHSFDTPLIINDDVELAVKCGADGVHIGKHDADLPTARTRLGDDTIIGVSCYNDLALALAAQEQRADYVAFGSFFASPTKPGAVQAGVHLLSSARQKLNIPICAIGGITAHNAAPLIEAGADMVAVIGGLFATENVTRAAQQLSILFV